MTDNDIKKALECCINDDCDNCPDTFGNCEHNAMRNALDLINRLEKENNDLFLELEGVMWSVDKWLDGDELKQDKVNRAITMREKTLQITEKQEAEIEKLNVELVGMRGACESYKMHYDKAQIEIERLKAEKEEYPFKCKVGNNSEIHSKSIQDYDRLIDDISTEAIKEFAKKVETELEERVSESIRNRNPHWYIAKRIVRETAIEMTESPTKIEHSSLCETDTYEVKE